MLTIQLLNKKIAESLNAIRAVADIEVIIQPQDSWNYQALNNLLEQDTIQLLIIKNKLEKVVGYCLYQVVFEQAEILRIGTHPDYQRQGIASKLFVELHEQLEALQVESLLLEVRADNVPAIALYERQRFSVIHQRKGYYSQPNLPAVDALIMQRIY